MSFIAYGGEKRVTDLVTRVWGKQSAADSKRAAAALIKANPQLADLAQVARGRPIAVPTVTGLTERDESGSSAPLALPVDGLRASVAGFVDRLGAEVKRERQDLKRTRALIEREDLRRVAAASSAAAELLEQIAESTDQRAAELETRVAFAKRLRATDKELAALAKTLE